MRLFPLLLLTALLVSSCASIFNSPYKRITIHTEKPAMIYYNDGSVKTNNLVKTNNYLAAIHVKRKNDSLQFSVHNDSTFQKYSVKRKLSFAFWANIPFKFGIGMLVDFTNPKRFTYPTHIYLDSTEKKKGYYTYEKNIPKKAWELQMNIPFVNLHHRIDAYDQNDIITGFFGLGLGVNYFYQNNKYLNFSAHSMLLNNVPLPPPFIVFWEKNSKEYFHQVTLSNNHRIQKFNIGYGLSYSLSEMKYTVSLPRTNETAIVHLNASLPITRPAEVEKMSKKISPGRYETHWKKVQAIGLWFPLSYELTKGLSASFQYRPTFYNYNSKMMQYQAFYSFGLIYRSRL